MIRPVNRIHSLNDLYKHYTESGGSLPKQVFYRVVFDFHQEVVTQILLEGEEYSLGSRLSSVRIVKLKRNYNKPSVDFGATNKYRRDNPDEPNVVVYYTNQPFVYKFYWAKHKCLVPNKRVYRLELTGGPNGNKRKITKKLNSDEFAYLNFKDYGLPDSLFPKHNSKSL